jgi:hypothetical protein
MTRHLPNYAPPDDDVAAPFWEAIAHGEIRMPRCSSCGRWQWYPTEAGADCPNGELVWETVPKRGTLYTFTRVERAFLPSGQGDVPFVVGFIELDGVGGVRLVANVVDDEQLEIGMRVEAEFVEVDGRHHLLFRSSH